MANTKQIASWPNFWSPFSDFSFCSIVGLWRFLAAFVLCILAAPLWHSMSSPAASLAWCDLSISVMPTLIGVTITAFALICTFGDERFRIAFSRQSFLEKSRFGLFQNAVSMPFVWYIVVQMCALLFAILGKAWSSLAASESWIFCALSAIGCLFFFYAIVCTSTIPYLIFGYMQKYSSYQYKNSQNVEKPVPAELASTATATSGTMDAPDKNSPDS